MTALSPNLGVPGPGLSVPNLAAIAEFFSTGGRASNEGKSWTEQGRTSDYHDFFADSVDAM